MRKKIIIDTNQITREWESHPAVGVKVRYNEYGILEVEHKNEVRFFRKLSTATKVGIENRDGSFPFLYEWQAPRNIIKVILGISTGTQLAVFYDKDTMEQYILNLENQEKLKNTDTAHLQHSLKGTKNFQIHELTESEGIQHTVLYLDRHLRNTEFCQVLSDIGTPSEALNNLNNTSLVWDAIFDYRKYVEKLHIEESFQGLAQ